jgi:flagellar biosynthesis anti-sigma factor FlgM
MKITSNNPVLHVDPKAQSKGVGAQKTPELEIQERVSVSKQARSIQVDQLQVRATLDAVDDVRMDKVDEIRRQIADGTYQRDPAQVADKMIATHLFESLFRK